MQFLRATRRHTPLLALGALLLSCSPSGPATITVADLSRDVSYLASDDLAGRLIGTPEIARAEEYIAGAFRSAGLAPLPGAKGYFVDYTAWRQGYDPSGTTLAVTSSSSPLPPATLGVDFRPFDFSTAGTVTADLVFAGYGITAPEYGYDDYRGLDVRGKVVLLLRYEPNENDPQSVFAGTRHTPYAYFATKVRNAREHGAVGMLLFTTPLAHDPDEDLRPSSAYRLHPGDLESGGTSDRPPFIALQISQGFADLLARAAGTTIRDLQTAVDRGAHPAELGIRGLAVTSAVARTGSPEPVAARDVVGYLRGSAVDRVVLVGAHHDHLGAYSQAGEVDTVYNGADDNASGVAGVLALARAFGGRRPRPRQSIIFATFSGEEEYLLGSSALLDSGLVTPSTLSFMLNLDMIGRNPGGEVEVYGTSGAPDLRSVVEKANEPPALPLAFPTQLADNLDSDQSVFRRAGVPSLFFHTGLHDDYHGLKDEADRLDYDRLRRLVELAYRVLDERSAVGGTAAAPPTP